MRKFQAIDNDKKIQLLQITKVGKYVDINRNGWTDIIHCIYRVTYIVGKLEFIFKGIIHKTTKL